MSRAIFTVSSLLQSSTRRISSTHPGGKSARVAASVDFALYAGSTAMTLCFRLGTGSAGFRMRSTWNGGWAGLSGGSVNRVEDMASAVGSGRGQPQLYDPKVIGAFRGNREGPRGGT